MSGFSVKVEGIDRAETLLKPFIWRKAISFMLNRKAKKMKQAIPVKLKTLYTHSKAYGGDVADLTLSSASTLQLGFAFKNKPIPLLEFEHVKVPFAKGATGAKVRIKKKSGFKLVRGRNNYKGFVHKNRIFMRKQKPTWRNKVRLPYRPLFGIAAARMMNSPEMKKYMAEWGGDKDFKIEVEKFI